MKRSTGGDATFGALLFIAALAPRLWFALAYAAEPVWDGHYYDFAAQRIAAGLGYSDDRSVQGHLVWHPWCHYPVGYSAFLAFFFRLLGPSHAAASVANALVGAALAVVTWALAREALSTTVRARIAGIIVALHPGLVLYAALVMSEPLAALLTLLAFFLVVRDTRVWRGLLSGAATLGLAALVRPQALLCAPFFAARFRGMRARAAAAITACAGALLVVMPWTIRNCRVMDGCALVSTNAGWNLAIGAFPRATGRFETLHSSDGCRDVTGQVEQDRCWLKYGLEQIRARPIRWLSLVPAKLGFTFDHESFAVEYLHEARPDVWPEPRRVAIRTATTLVHRWLLAAAALGGVALPLGRVAARRMVFGERLEPVPTRALAAQGALLAAIVLLSALSLAGDAPVFWPLAVAAATVPLLPLPGAPPRCPAMTLCASLLATTLATHAVFFGEDRYHIVVTPVLALFAAAALRRPALLPLRTRDAAVATDQP